LGIQLTEIPVISYVLLIFLVLFLISLIISAIANSKKKIIFRDKVKACLASGEITNHEYESIELSLKKQGVVYAEKFLNSIFAQKKKEKEIADYLQYAYSFLEKGEITGDNYKELKGNIYGKGLKWAELYMKQSVLSMQLLQVFISKYGNDKGVMLFNKQFFLGMTKEELTDSAGDPDKIETEVMKTKIKEIWIYGNKSSGDIFVFEDGLLTRFKDR
ncbi:MAG: hypothetical protein ACRC3B_21105, partial [Bacteroidia bacterium]